jgi:hypothetical protein
MGIATRRGEGASEMRGKVIKSLASVKPGSILHVSWDEYYSKYNIPLKVLHCSKIAAPFKRTFMGTDVFLNTPGILLLGELDQPAREKSHSKGFGEYVIYILYKDNEGTIRSDYNNGFAYALPHAEKSPHLLDRNQKKTFNIAWSVYRGFQVRYRAKEI